jgi:hypothetical protein
MMLSLLRTVLVLAGLAAPALAVQLPSLPASAKKLTGAEIKALYDGKTFTFTAYTFFGVATGTVTYDFQTGTSHGSYNLGWHNGDIDGRIHLDGDKFCYKVGLDREHCDFMYSAGQSIYDVDPNGTVQSVNQQQ